MKEEHSHNSWKLLKIEDEFEKISQREQKSTKNRKKKNRELVQAFQKEKTEKSPAK